MSKNTSLFQNEEEHEVLAVANTIAEKQGLPSGASIEEIIEQGEIELDLQMMQVRVQARVLKALKALRPAKPRQEQPRSKAQQTHNAIAFIVDMLADVEGPMPTLEIADICVYVGIPEMLARYTLELLALEGKIALGPDGWVIQDENAPADTVG